MKPENNTELILQKKERVELLSIKRYKTSKFYIHLPCLSPSSPNTTVDMAGIDEQPFIRSTSYRSSVIATQFCASIHEVTRNYP
jgi:hypothetical protein